MSIQAKIDQAIHHLGSISIQDFIEISNFDNEGFYNKKENEKISRKGHFITSPEITPLFGYTLCNQFLKQFPNTKKVQLLELGPGNGTLTQDIINFLEGNNVNISQITLIEKSEYFKNRLKKKFDKDIKILENLSHIEQKNDETLFIYSNEFFDALGSKQFIYNNDEFYEIAINKDQNQYKLIHQRSLLSDFLKEFYASYDFIDGDILEHSNLTLNFFNDIKNILGKSFFFSATDYGYQNISKKSTLRLISDHQKINLFEKFENVDYSFGVNFELFNNFFLNFKPIIESQSALVSNFLPSEYQKTNHKETLKAVELIKGKKFDDMGNSFFNISFYKL